MTSAAHVAVEYLLIGHVSADVSNGGWQLGGTAAFAGLTASAIGLKTGILTSARPDFDLSRLGRIEVERVPSESTTSYENSYSPSGQRIQTLHSRAAVLRPAHLPQAWRAAPIVHLGPIADEIDLSMLNSIQGPFVGVTPQGWMRSWNPEGITLSRKWVPPPEVAGRISAVVLSEEDLRYDEQEAQRLAGIFDLLVLTRSSRGCTIFQNGTTQDVPAIVPTRTDDPTGAGDIFAAAFFIVYSASQDPLRAARFANHVAGVGIARSGLESIPYPEEIAAARKSVQ